ncbi:MAG TPA: hypothetical protein VGG04_06610 [Candidatus Sulfotelmatobacter sp.]
MEGCDPFGAVEGLLPGVPLVVPGVEPGEVDVEPLEDELGTHGDVGVV